MDLNKLNPRGFLTILLGIILTGFLAAGMTGYIIDFTICLIKKIIF